MTNLDHERLPGGLITDLSNWNILIEIKNAKKFREVYGQVNQYALFRPEAQKVICLFGPVPNPTILRSYMEVCQNTGVELVWLFSEEIYEILQEETIL